MTSIGTARAIPQRNITEHAPIGDAEQFTSQGSQGGMSHRCVVDRLDSERVLGGMAVRKDAGQHDHASV